MRRTTLLFVAMALCLAPLSAFADSYWYKTVGGSGKSNRISNLGPGESAYFQEVGTGTEDSKILDVTRCASWTGVVINSSGGVGTVFFHESMEWNDRAGVVGTSVKILNDAGDVAMTGSEAAGLAWMWNVRGSRYPWIEISVAPAGVTTVTVRITCSNEDAD